MAQRKRRRPDPARRPRPPGSSRPPQVAPQAAPCARPTVERAAQERAFAGRAQRVALVLIAAIVAWFGLQWMGGALGWPAAVAFAIDGLALLAFGWALWATHGLWRRRRGMKG